MMYCRRKQYRPFRYAKLAIVGDPIVVVMKRHLKLIILQRQLEILPRTFRYEECDAEENTWMPRGGMGKPNFRDEAVSGLSKKVGVHMVYS